ncbi:MAG: NUDIX hydrolase [Burkholderiales bacterium]|nr:NUDIX hydrolase [Burkholderiales bacterium]
MTQRWKPHVTVAAVIERDGRFLLVEEQTPDGLQLNQPAGHLESGESLLQAVVRETREETARTFEPEALLGIYQARGNTPQNQEVTYLRFAFVGRVGDPLAGQALDDGIVRTLWATPEQIRAERARHRSPLLMQCVDDYLRGQRYPLELIYTHAAPAAAPEGT